MRDFELNSKMIIGQYVPSDSPLHQMEPALKLTGFGLLLLAAAFSPSPIGVAFGLIFTLEGLWITKISLHFALKGLITPLPFLVIIALIQVFLVSATDPVPIFSLGFLSVSVAGLKAALLLMLRFAVLMLMLSWMSFCVSTSEMIYGLGRILGPLKRIGVQPMDFVMTIQIMFRFLPILAQSAERIAKAQASRGADWDRGSGGLVGRIRRVVPLILPLFTASLKRSEKIAMAMDARAYGYHAERTSMKQYTTRAWDVLLLIASMISCVLIVAI